MAGFYKVVLRGTAAAQDINNILYYSSLTPDAIAWDAELAQELGESVNAAWIAEILPLLPGSYSFEGCDVAMVNEDGIVTSDFTVTVPDTGTGIVGEVTAGVAAVAICKFNCSAATLVNPHPVPKRSYLALGPLTEPSIDANGALLTQTAWQAAATAAFTQGHLVGTTQVVPYRVGRITPDAPAGVGRVVSAVVRPFSSFRRSRLLSPTGK